MPLDFWTTACLYGATSVAAGAFGAHGLRARGIPDAKIASWSTAAQYQLVHSAALLAVEAASPGKNLLYAKSFLLAGMTLFSGSIYLLVLDPQRFKFLGPVTPIGGLALIAGWGALAVGSRGRALLK
ncbi:hypothetical protein B0A48_13762 [Cryoendolithus antarcticus]|uniref:Uncharacterized protein n=1 Tax=Cryoendolithus antarcticus TaxID=1507870 RepID=A0A1V8SMQ3_9PEZI|nr:hypothetical protein B0A48_13762 [Cryoendolithus antarcticus]